MKKRYAMGLFMSLGLLLGACSSGNTGADGGKGGESGKQVTVEDVKKNGKLKVGVKEDVPGFGLRNTETDQIEGFEIDLAKKIAEDILGDAEAIDLTPVTAKTRGPLLDNGELDMVIATFTITDERKETYNFTEPYYEDAVGVLVKKDKGYTGLKDMDGATIGVSQSSTTKDAVQEEADKYDAKLKFSEFPNYPEIKAALDSNRIQGFAVDRSILNGYLDDSTEILPDRFATQDYGIAIKKTNTELAEHVDELVKKWKEDGTLDSIVSEWGMDE